MRASACLLVLVAGCDWAFGLHETHTQAVDAQYFDAPPFTCPAGGAAPTFQSAAYPIPLPSLVDCTSYSASDTGFAMAICYFNGGCGTGSASGAFELVAGQVGSAMAPISFGFDTCNVGANSYVRLSHDGQRAVVFVAYPPSSPTTYTFDVIAPSTSTTGWETIGALPLAETLPAQWASNPSDPIGGSGRHVIVNVQNQDFVELVGDGSSWSQQGSAAPYSDYGIADVERAPALSYDALTIVGMGVVTTPAPVSPLFLSRAATSGPFGDPQPIELPAANQYDSLTLLDNCARLYAQTAVSRPVYFEQ